MNVTQDEAKKKVCPLSERKDFCRASWCMAWRWSEDETISITPSCGSELCEIATQDAPGVCDDKWLCRGWFKKYGTESVVKLQDRKGYCGMARA